MTDDRLYPDRPIVGVGVVVWRGDEVLLVRRGKPPRIGEWSLPGGKQELGETVVEAAAREVREECGIEIDVGPLLDVVDAIRPDEAGRIRIHYTLVDFVAAWRSGELVAGDDADACRWVLRAALAEYRLWSETVRMIELADAVRRQGRG